MTVHARVCVWLMLLLPCVALADPPVTIGAEGCFTGMAPRGGVYPVVVSLHNAGASADGALIVKSESYSDVLRTYAYPVSLPTGTDKRIVVYPALGSEVSQIDLSFQGAAQAKDAALPLTNRDGQQVGMIGDETGALSALRLALPRGRMPGSRASSSVSSSQYNDCYARPEDAPDRAAGYQSVSVLALGAGAERLRPEQWAAIRRWVLDGGSLVLIGGAGASYLRVPEAAALLPVTGLRDVSLPSLALPARIFRSPLPPGPVALVSGTVRPGGAVLASQGGQPVLTRQTVGAGTVLLVGFSPLEQPLRGWTGQRDLWLALFYQASASVPAWNLRQWIGRQATFNTYGGGYASSYGRGGGVYATNQINPFRIKLPPLTTIAWLFGAYFILVVPVTYVVLKRLGRLEWAWVTSPLLSIAFAYAFYLFTAQLYHAGMSRRTAGVVVAAAGDPDAQFDGFSELFVPRGGSYTVGIPNAEALELAPFSGGDPGYGYYSYSRSSGGTQLQSLQTVDGGDVSAPDFRLGNLAFRRLYHTEPVALGGAVTATLTRVANGGLAGTVRNGTAQTLLGGCVYLPASGTYALVGDLQPGQSRAVGGPDSTAAMAQTVQASPFAESPYQRTSFQRDPSMQAGAFFLARTNGAVFGPAALGRDVGGAGSVTVLVSVPVRGGIPVGAGGQP